MHAVPRATRTVPPVRAAVRRPCCPLTPQRPSQTTSSRIGSVVVATGPAETLSSRIRINPAFARARLLASSSVTYARLTWRPIFEIVRRVLIVPAVTKVSVGIRLRCAMPTPPHALARVTVVAMQSGGTATVRVDNSDQTFTVPIEANTGGGLRVGSSESIVHADAVPSPYYGGGEHLALLHGTPGDETLVDVVAVSAHGVGSKHTVQVEGEEDYFITLDLNE
jgi:hypothetical protein